MLLSSTFLKDINQYYFIRVYCEATEVKEGSEGAEDDENGEDDKDYEDGEGDKDYEDYENDENSASQNKDNIKEKKGLTLKKR